MRAKGGRIPRFGRMWFPQVATQGLAGNVEHEHDELVRKAVAHCLASSGVAAIFKSARATVSRRSGCGPE
jgi:hypothetical protein